MDKEEREEKRKKRKEEVKLLGFNPAHATLAAGLGAEALTQAPMLAPMHMLDPLADPARPLKNTPMGGRISELADFTHREAKAIRQFAKAQGVKIPIVRATQAYYRPPEGAILKAIRKLIADAPDAIPEHIGLSTTSLPTAFHEIGHATPIMGSAKLRKAWHTLAGLMAGGGGGALRLALLAGAAAPKSGESPVAEALQEHAPEIVGATFAPSLLEELRANVHATKGLRRQGMNLGRAIVSHAPAFGSHMAPAAASILATVLAQRLGSSLRDTVEKRKAEKTAAPREDIRAPGSLRLPAAAAWRMSSAVSRPKTTTPQLEGRPVAKSSPPTRPPSKSGFYRDMMRTLYNPQRGFRMAVSG